MLSNLESKKAGYMAGWENQKIIKCLKLPLPNSRIDVDCNVQNAFQ